MYIVKRDGTRAIFDNTKIEKAILKAAVAVDGKASAETAAIAKSIANSIAKEAEKTGKDLAIEDIQDMVELGLMDSPRHDIAKAYITYRRERADKRNLQSSFFVKKIKDALEANNVQNQNANMDEHSFGGRMGEARNVVTKEYALNYLMSDLARENHLNNRVYTHDLDSYASGMHNCLSVPFDELLANGIELKQTSIRPARSVSTAFQLVAVLFQLQSLMQFGGVSATHIDWTMVPYMKISFFKHYLINYIKTLDTFTNLDIDKMTEEELDDWVSDNKAAYLKEMGLTEQDICMDNKANLDNYLYKAAMFDTRRELYQAIEGMYHNLNTLQSRSGNQLPFTSINYGTCTLPEGRLVIRALLDVSIKGIGKLHLTPIFPCGIFQCMRGVNRKPGDPNYNLYRLALKSTEKRLYPNYANVDWSGNAGFDINDPKTYFSTMGCRTANGYDINADPGVNPQTKDGRGNICPVTIIMPTLAMEAEGDVERFMQILDKTIEEARDQLLERFEYICSQPMESARFMYENGTMMGFDGKDIRSALKHGTIVIGQLGLAETLQILIGTDHTTDKGMELAKRIEQLFKDRCAQYKRDYKLNFGVYYTPAENLCYTAMKKFRERYGIIPNVSDKDFFTNSIHVPVWKTVDPFEKIDIEAQLTGYSSAGCITYVEFDSAAAHNLDAMEAIVNYAMDKDIPYFAINVPNDSCLDCGYTGEFNNECPMCGSKHIRQLRRVTGYLTDNYTTSFNPGKQQEVKMRYQHTKATKCAED